MAEYTRISEVQSTSFDESEKDTLLDSDMGHTLLTKGRSKWERLQIPVLYLSNLLLLTVVLVLSLETLHMSRDGQKDPSASVYCMKNTSHIILLSEVTR